MNIYFSGIGGVGIGPLAEIAHDAGHIVHGSDAHESLVTAELQKRGISVSFDQSGEYLEYLHRQQKIDWLVYTSSLPADHAELAKAKELGIVCAKRDELLTYILKEKNLKLIAIAGTHGKTTTTGMMVWTMRQLGIPVSYSIGTTLSFGPAGFYDPDSQYFVYECDEFDRNFLHFSPHIALMTSIDYDHPDTYPTQHDYTAAFTTFMSQSEQVIMWRKDAVNVVEAPLKHAWVLGEDEVANYHIPGLHNRANATLIAKACEKLRLGDPERIARAVESFPGTARRFERLGTNLYSDYGHHPVEIAATLEMARELNDHVVLVYQPHQNVRQHQVKDAYNTTFLLAEEVYWLPTYLSREDQNLPVLSPSELVSNIVNRAIIHEVALDDNLWSIIETARAQGKLVLCMGAGDIDAWVRQRATAGSVA